MSIENVQTEHQTVFKVWERILENHPEVTRQTAKYYANTQHGHPVIQTIEVLPRERILWSDSESSFYGPDNKIKAIGARVETRPPGHDPDIDYSGIYRWTDGDFLEIDPKLEKSFVFVDFESSPSKEVLSMSIKALKYWENDWYLLDSGGGYHLIMDVLTDPKNLPKYFGQLIMDVSRQMSPAKAILYGHVGNYLIQNCDNKKKLKLWIDDALDRFGHIGDESGKLVFPIDMRYIAHVLEATIAGEMNEGYLRVSSKYGSVPILVAEQINRKVNIFEVSNNHYNERQLSFPI